MTVGVSPDPRRRATLVGALAVLMWGLLALFTAWSGHVPPFQLVAMAFAVAASLSVVKWIARRESPAIYMRQPVAAWLIGVGGLFGYHFLFFLAMRNAPAVPASLINYLWPLLIVLFSALLPGERLRWWHLLGAMMGLCGTALLVTDGRGLAGFDPAHGFGYLAAAGAAFTWAGYSVSNRRFADVPTDTVGGFCLVTAVLATLCHLMFEVTHWPQDTTQWLAVLGLGLMPVGGAFYVWDYGTKRGHIQVLGALAYGAPLISTFLLILFGLGVASWSVVAAAALIVGGAVLASKTLFRP